MKTKKKIKQEIRDLLVTLEGLYPYTAAEFIAELYKESHL